MGFAAKFCKVCALLGKIVDIGQNNVFIASLGYITKVDLPVSQENCGLVGGFNNTFFVKLVRSLCCQLGEP